MDRDRGSRDESAQVLARLRSLEDELRVLRRELSDSRDGASLLPGSDLHVLRCRIADDVYGVAIDSVLEIVRYVRVTRVAEVAASVAGAINVRGNLVAVVDGRRRLGRAVQAPRRGTAIVLVKVAGRAMGLVVDEVQDVVLIKHATLRAPTGALANADVIAAIATTDNGVLQVLELGRLLSASDWTRVRHAIESEAPAAATRDGAGDADR